MKKAKFRPLSGHDNNSALLTYVRIGIVALAVLVQLALMLLFTTWLRTYAALLYMLLDILAGKQIALRQMQGYQVILRESTK